ncbi:LicD family-domain-containing protein [Chytriomyces cf. hyalinus JEL632]|nr:LicD family-domain-containing protein [Chytriomyces cf. hyalinus JEL632]
MRKAAFRRFLTLQALILCTVAALPVLYLALPRAVVISPYVENDTQRTHHQYQYEEHADNHFAYLWKSEVSNPASSQKFIFLEIAAANDSQPEQTAAATFRSQTNCGSKKEQLPTYPSQFEAICQRVSGFDTGDFRNLSHTHFSLSQRTPAAFNFSQKADFMRQNYNFKYFFEAGSDGKRDERFAEKSSTPKNPQAPPNHDLSTSNKSLRALIKAWSQFCREQHISWWLAHGTLLGWQWNTRILPWDTDLDIQMTVRELLHVAARFNQTLLNSRFLVDVSPSIVVRSAQAYSAIDARLIDTKTGYLMDITGLAFLDGSEDTVVCKKPHAYQLTDILPLHETVFEGVKVWRPHAALRILKEEYGEAALVSTTYRPSTISRIYKWNDGGNEWIAS